LHDPSREFDDDAKRAVDFPHGRHATPVLVGFLWWQSAISLQCF
jgi:hypothetical protein